MKTLHLTDTERQFLIFLLKSLIDSESADPHIVEFPDDCVRMKTILSKLSSENG
jgi:hypothetical protein